MAPVNRTRVVFGARLAIVALTLRLAPNVLLSALTLLTTDEP